MWVNTEKEHVNQIVGTRQGGFPGKDGDQAEFLKDKKELAR